MLTSNRDEHSRRLQASGPAIHAGVSGSMLYPTDGDAGGTWIGAHERGHAVVLLNGCDQNHIRANHYRKSRGLVLVDLLDQENPLSRFDQVDLEGIEPFTVVVWTQGQLWECRWNGLAKFLQRRSGGEARIWSSVTLYQEEVIAKRRSWFDRWRMDVPVPTQEQILDFHLFTGDGDKTNDVLMNRNNQIFTVSISSIQLGKHSASMTYLDLLAHQKLAGELQICQPTESE